MQDGQHRTIGHRIEELVGMPSGSEWSGFHFAIADDAGNDQIRIIECRSKRVAKRISQLTALVDRSRTFRRCMAGNSSGKRKLNEELPQSVLILTDVGVDLAISALQVSVGHDGRAAVAGA